MQSVEDQKRLLHALWPLLKSGGILVYATCSVLKEENHEQIHEFLARHPEASTRPESGIMRRSSTFAAALPEVRVALESLASRYTIVAVTNEDLRAARKQD